MDLTSGDTLNHAKERERENEREREKKLKPKGGTRSKWRPRGAREQGEGPSGA